MTQITPYNPANAQKPFLRELVTDCKDIFHSVDSLAVEYIHQTKPIKSKSKKGYVTTTPSRPITGFSTLGSDKKVGILVESTGTTTYSTKRFSFSLDGIKGGLKTNPIDAMKDFLDTLKLYLEDDEFIESVNDVENTRFILERLRNSLV